MKILFAHSAGSQSGVGEGSFDLVSHLKQQLPSELTVSYPIIENPEAPTYEMWKKVLDDEFKLTTKPIILVGHSLGGSMLLKYISEEKPTIQVVGLFLIGTPFWGKNDWDVHDYTLRENFELELRQIKEIFLYHSVGDTVVPFDHLAEYKKAFPDAIVRVIHGTDHSFVNGLTVLVEDIKSILM